MLSVLVAVFDGDRSSWLEESLQSLVQQSRPANEVVVVLDGPVSAELTDVLDRYVAWLPLKVIATPKNGGLGAALSVGLPHCSHPYVARMDADDICLPNRFEKQLRFLEEHPDIEVLGAWIGEFDNEFPDRIYARRRVPHAHGDILKFARLRNPFNHMTVVFRKSAIDRVGGYRPVRGLEDYDLWVRVLLSGAKTANLPEVLVWARAGATLSTRRGGLSYLLREYALLLAFYRSGFIGLSHLIVGLVTRSAVRLAPPKLREIGYRGIRFLGGYKY